jgi:hypothetical protein
LAQEPPDQFDDGSVEVVEVNAARKRPSVDEVSVVAAAPAGGRMATMREAGNEHRQNFILIRTPRGVAKIAFPHFGLYKVLWRLWQAKRAAGEPDPGVSVQELVEATGFTQQSVQNTLTSMRRNEIIRSVVQHVGWRGTRGRYYPTSVGDEALKMAEYLGAGSMVQIGRNATAWRARNQDEPQDMFKFAAFLRGSVAKANTAAEIS